MAICILHVEDDPDIQEIAAIALESVGGYRTVQVSSGAAAIEAVRGGLRPDLYLLDVMMPGLGGEQTLAELRKLPGQAAVPAIFMTAKAQEADIAGLRRLGAIGVIVKPFDPMMLATRIGELWTDSTGG
ncbi:response regulator [Frigidibacter oleivorans]|uniref:response regulator n=1 Tax=Frigidibacter oleivorans TaxID=2487129 RepID=UPI000F8E71F7|nr:response regulator [Frigidibacter oleivorans]